MISIQGKDNIVDIRWQGREIIAKYFGSLLVWSKTRSCYGRGYWIPEYPWIDNDIWKNE